MICSRFSFWTLLKIRFFDHVLYARKFDPGLFFRYRHQNHIYGIDFLRFAIFSFFSNDLGRLQRRADTVFLRQWVLVFHGWEMIGRKNM